MNYTRIELFRNLPFFPQFSAVPEPDSNSNSTNVNNTKYSDTEAEKSNTSINSIAIPARVFENITSNETGVLFSFYIDDALFPIRINQTESENTTYKAIGSSVISATLAGLTIKNVPELINITMSIIISVSPELIFADHAYNYAVAMDLL